jgi:hypothetical protein
MNTGGWVLQKDDNEPSPAIMAGNFLTGLADIDF